MMLLKAFLVGGALCMLGQILVDRTRLTPARILSGYVVAGVVLSAVGLYQPLVDFAGAGAAVPLTGFGHLLAKGVREAVQKDGFLGALTGGLVVPFKIVASGRLSNEKNHVFFALLCAILFRAKAKR